jgi:hypothetical protein
MPSFCRNLRLGGRASELPTLLAARALTSIASQIALENDRGGKRVSAQLHRQMRRSLCQAPGSRQRSPPLLDSRHLDEILCWRERRGVSHQLVVNYSRMKLTLTPAGLAFHLRGNMVDVYDFPEGRLEVRWKGRSLPYSAFDKLQRVSHAAILENKRLGEILAWIN